MWPFRKRRPEAVPDPGLPPEVELIGAETPRRFSIGLADAERAGAARDLILGNLGRELTVDVADSSGRPVLDVASNFQPESAAVLRPLNVLHRAGIAVTGLELRGLVTELSDEVLTRIVDDWKTHGNTGPYRRRVERLAGLELLDRCVAATDEAERRPLRGLTPWRFAVRCVAFNTPGAEALTLTEAASGSDARAEWLVDAAVDRVGLARLSGLDVTVPADRLEAVLRGRGRAAELACHIAAQLPAPLDTGTAAALRDLAALGGEVAQEALRALHRADPTPELRATTDEELKSDDPNVRAAALLLLARHWTADARPAWRESLASKSAPMRWAAETAIGLYGTEEDLVDAAAHLATLARSRRAISMSPPRGSDIVDLLVRHRDNPTARAALADLTERWPKLPEDMRAWLVEQHPSLSRSDDVAEAAEVEALPAEDLVWPPPTIEADDGALELTFDEAAAHHPVRERFEELLERHASVEVLDGDREWLSVRIEHADPEGLVGDLWRAASTTPDA